MCFLTFLASMCGGVLEGAGENSFRELGRTITFRDLCSTDKTILGSIRKYLKGAGKIWALLSRSKEALLPPPIPPPTLSLGVPYIRVLSFGIEI